VNAFSTPLIDCFRQGEAPRDVRLMAARCGLALPPEAQLALLMLLVSDADAEVRAAAETTIDRLPRAQLAALVAIPEFPAEVREFFGARLRDGVSREPAAETTPPGETWPQLDSAEHADGAADAGTGVETDAQVADADETPDPDDQEPDRRGAAQRLAMLTVADRMKLAMLGSREERQVLVRDPNRLVSSAVLCSPKLTESEVECIARMTNVSGDVLRAVGTNRLWLKNYAVVAALTRNAKTPIAVALTLVNRLMERDIKFLSTDRNIPEPVRLAARKIYTQNVARRQ
jgi:hypothetical protein